MKFVDDYAYYVTTNWLLNPFSDLTQNGSGRCDWTGRPNRGKPSNGTPGFFHVFWIQRERREQGVVGRQKQISFLIKSVFDALKHQAIFLGGDHIRTAAPHVFKAFYKSA